MLLSSGISTVGGHIPAKLAGAVHWQRSLILLAGPTRIVKSAGCFQGCRKKVRMFAVMQKWIYGHGWRIGDAIRWRMRGLHKGKRFGPDV